MKAAALHGDHRRWPASLVLGAGVLLLVLSFVIGSARGAYAISPMQLWQVLLDMLGGSGQPSPEHLVFMNIRLPRLLLGVAAGAALGMSGALMQGLFRNPLADPGLIGVSSGAALAAGMTIVLGSMWFPDMPRTLGSWTLVLMAFLGSLFVTVLVYALSQQDGTTRVGIMLLAGVAVNALAGAGLGYLTFLATDEQLRNIQFWLLGSLGGARWSAVALVFSIVLAALGTGLTLARPLNAIALGETQGGAAGRAGRARQAFCRAGDGAGRGGRHGHHRHHRLYRPGGAALRAPGGRAQPPHRAAGLGPAGRGPGAGRRQRGPNHGQAGRTAAGRADGLCRRALLFAAAAPLQKSTLTHERTQHA
jgi:iron complex transport system permease protein